MLTLTFELSMSDFNSESIFRILMKNYTRDVHWVFDKTRIEFLGFLLVLYGVIFYFFLFSVFCINHDGLDVVSWQFGHQ